MTFRAFGSVRSELHEQLNISPLRQRPTHSLVEHRSQTRLELDLENSFLFRVPSAQIPQRRAIRTVRMEHVPGSALAAEADLPDTRAGVDDDSVLDTIE